MRIQSKITLSFVSLLALALISLAAVVTYVAHKSTLDALDEQSRERLVALRNIKQEQIESYFTLLQQQITSQAQSTMMQVAVQAFRMGFDRFIFESETLDKVQQTQTLERYYQNEFARHYNELNPNASLNIQQTLSQLSETSIALQHALIAKNPQPLGKKDQLNDLGDRTTYNTFHSLYHPIFQRFLKTFGYYDLFIVDHTTGNVLYSVYKELDFATSLKQGPYKQSGLAAAFNAALTLKPGESIITDFAPYTPSYEAPAAFIATPITVNGTIDGVLVYQIGVKKINDILSFNQAWQQAGLGNTGHSYLVGSDNTLRSEHRLWLQNPEQFNARAKQANMPMDVLEAINRRASTFGFLPTVTDSVQAAQDGQSGFMTSKGIFGQSLYSAYSPIKVGQLTWSLIVEEDVEDVRAHSAQLTQKMMFYAVLGTLIMLLLGISAAMYIGKKLATPMKRMNTKVQHIADHLNISARFNEPEGEKDELAEVSAAINHLLDSVESVVKDVEKTEQDLTESLDMLGETIHDVREASSKQESMTTGLLNNIRDMTQTSHSLTQAVTDNHLSSSETVDQANKGISATQHNQEITQKLNDVLQDTAAHVAQVAENTDSIVSVLDVIQSITEQTSLLALNAAIEAARAGEQGRGFAVVADEVRTLAKRTQDSTHEIKDIIERLQQGSQSSVQAMENAKAIVEETLASSEKVSNAFTAINKKIGSISDQNESISDTSYQQTELSEDMSKVVEAISEVARRNQKLMEKMHGFNEKVVSANALLNQSVQRFKTH